MDKMDQERTKINDIYWNNKTNMTRWNDNFFNYTIVLKITPFQNNGKFM
jgi:hypothetical protein